MRYHFTLLLVLVLLLLLGVPFTYAAEAPPPGPTVASPAAPAPTPLNTTQVDGRKEDEFTEEEKSILAEVMNAPELLAGPMRVLVLLNMAKNPLDLFSKELAEQVETVATKLAKDHPEIAIARSLLLVSSEASRWYKAYTDETSARSNDLAEAAKIIRELEAKAKPLEDALAEQMSRAGALAKENRDLQRKLDAIERQRKHGA